MATVSTIPASEGKGIKGSGQSSSNTGVLKPIPQIAHCFELCTAQNSGYIKP